MEDEHHQVGGWGYRIETWKPTLNIFFSLTSDTNCLQGNLIIFLCLSSLSLNVDLYVPSLSSSIQLLHFQLYIKLPKWQYQQEKYSSRGITPQEGPRQYQGCAGSYNSQWSKAALSQALLGPEDNRPSRDTRVFLLNGWQYSPKHI